MKTVDFDLGDMRLHLCMNGAALFDIYEKFGRKGQLLDHIQGNSKEAFANTCWLLWKLAEQGELVRRWMGHRPQPIPQERQLLALLGPLDVPRAKEAIGEAARLGFAMETPRERAERIDLGLQKLKEADGSDKVTMAQYLAPMLRLLNMNVHDALMLTPGQTGDLLAQVTRKEGVYGHACDLHQHQAGRRGGIQKADVQRQQRAEDAADGDGLQRGGLQGTG